MGLRCIISLLLFLPAPAWATCSDRVDAVVPHFTFSGGSRVDAALALGQQLNICLAFRNLPRKAFVELVTYDFRERRPIEIIREIFRQQHVEIARLPGGLVHVSRPSKTKSLFDHKIKAFNVGRTTLQTLSMGIRLRLERELDPTMQGVAGSYSSGDLSDIVGPFRVEGATVSQLLNL